MNLLKNMDIQLPAMALDLYENAKEVFERYRMWILGGAALLVVVFASWMIAHRQDDNALSAEFRTSAQQAYEAITSCENYKPYGGDSWRAREVDAELSLSAAITVAKTRADLRAAMALSDYLHEEKLVHMARQNRDARNAKHDIVSSTRELKSAKLKVQTAMKVS